MLNFCKSNNFPQTHRVYSNLIRQKSKIFATFPKGEGMPPAGGFLCTNKTPVRNLTGVYVPYYR